MTGMSQTGCCCGELSAGGCGGCTHVAAFCCVTVSPSRWAHPIPCYNASCPDEHCGLANGLWDDLPCGPRVELAWRVLPVSEEYPEECTRVLMKLTMTELVPIPHGIVPGLLSLASVTKSTTLEVGSDWYSGGFVIEDPIHASLISTYPSMYSGPVSDVAVSVRCGGTQPVKGDVVFIKAETETLISGNWIVACSDMYTRGWCLCATHGVCPFQHEGAECGNDGGSDRTRAVWRYVISTGSVWIGTWEAVTPATGVIGFYGSFVDTGSLCPSSGTIPCGDASGESSTLRMVYETFEECPNGSDPDPPPPPPPPPFCKKISLCVLLVTDEGLNYLYYTLDWNPATEQYEMEAQPVPGDKPYTIELVMVEVVGDPRSWELTVIIRDASEDIVFESTETYVIDCTDAWSITQSLTIPIDPEETWDLTIATACPDAPDPPECDPLCWPECILCPDPLSLSLVVSQDPSCCLFGTYGLTYNSGSNWFTLPAQVGGPDGICGIILTCKVTCVSETQVHVNMTYRNVNGSEHTVNVDLDATCTGGVFETDTHAIPSSLFAPGLCEGGLGLGSLIRIVGI